MFYKLWLYIVIITVILLHSIVYIQETTSNKVLLVNLISETVKSVSETTSTSIKIDSGDSIGTLIIDRIDLEISVIEEANEKNLKLGAAHILYTSLPWEKGNCFISAHRSWRYGQMFNRLNELGNGDEIILITGRQILRYKVAAQEIVEPDNIEVFKKNYDLTLTTCTPLYTATHRLIIYCLRTI